MRLLYPMIKDKRLKLCKRISISLKCLQQKTSLAQSHNGLNLAKTVKSAAGC